MSYGPVANIGPLMITPASSTLEDGSTGQWVVRAGCTIANSTAQAHSGTHSLAMTCNANGNMSIGTAGGLAAIPVLPNTPYTAQGWWYTTTPHQGYFAIQWLDRTGSLIIQATMTPQAELTSTWTNIIWNTVSDPNAAFALFIPAVQAAISGEVHYLDDITFNQGIYYPS